MRSDNQTIVAVASGTGGAIALIRISGPEAIPIADRLFSKRSKGTLSQEKGYTLHYGEIREDDRLIDDVIVSLFRAPHSYTGEDMVEISCHGSSYIRHEILRLCHLNGARSAQPGEFTLRAFLSGKMDLSQAEAVADMIAAENQAAHQLATRQIRAGYSEEFQGLREQLIDLAALLELELDFGEEDVEFADRSALHAMMELIGAKIRQLALSFQLGNVLKNGIPVAIVGVPNVGKSTLLNALVKEERAMVSDIAGTTRDVIEERINIDGVMFRLIDTAGIRQTDDPLESMGIERTFARLDEATIVLLMVDIRESVESILAQIDSIDIRPDQSLALLLNKVDRVTPEELSLKLVSLHTQTGYRTIGLCAKEGENLKVLLDFLRQSVDTSALQGKDVIVFNARHYEALTAALDAIERAEEALREEVSGDLLSQDIREVLHHLGTITGEITTDDILGSIFSKFCIGK